MSTISFKIESLTADELNIIEVGASALAGDQRGGIAVTNDAVFRTGDSGTVVSDLDLSAPARVAGDPRYDGLFSDLATGDLYTFGTSATTPYVSSFTDITHIIPLDPITGEIAGPGIALSASIPVTSGSSGVFAGAGRVVIYSARDGRLYDIELATGEVDDLGAFSRPNMRFSESWASWGVAEFFDDELHLAYVSNNAQDIERIRVSDRQIETIATFPSLGDMASFTVSPQEGRWYFGHEGGSTIGSQFNSFAEGLGFATASVSIAAIAIADFGPTLRTEAIDAIDVTFDEEIDESTFTVADLMLTRDDVDVPLTSDVTITEIAENTYRVAGLEAFTGDEGAYALRINTSGVSDPSGDPLFDGRTVSWTNDQTFAEIDTRLMSGASLIRQGEETREIGAGEAGAQALTVSLDAGQTFSFVAAPSAGLQVTIDFLDSSGATIATTTASAAGETAILQTAPVAADGEYTVRVSSANDGAGAVQMTATLNAAIDADVIAAGGNDTIETAQDIDASFISIGDTAERGGVVGGGGNVLLVADRWVSGTLRVIDEASAQIVDNLTLTLPGGTISTGYGVATDPTTGAIYGLFDTSNGSGRLLEIDLRTGDVVDLGALNVNDLRYGQIAFDGDGNLYGVTVGDNRLNEENRNALYRIDLQDPSTQERVLQFSTDDQQGGGGIAFNPDDGLFYRVQRGQFVSIDLSTDTPTVTSIPVSGLLSSNSVQGMLYRGDGEFLIVGGGDDLFTLNIDGTSDRLASNLDSSISARPRGFAETGEPDVDVYAFSLEAGQSADIVVDRLEFQEPGFGRTLEILDETGQVLASGVSDSAQFDQLVSAFIAPETGTYYARVTSETTSLNDYGLVVTRGATLDATTNGSAANAAPIGSSGSSVGRLSNSTVYTVDERSTLYRMDAETGELLDIIGDIGFGRVRGLDAHPVTGELYGWAQGRGLIKIDQDTGAGTLVDQSGDATAFDFADISFAPNGDLFGYTGEIVRNSTNNTSFIHQIDLETGATTPLVSTIGSSGTERQAFAINADGEFFVKTSNSLYQVDPTDGQTIATSAFSGNTSYNALDFAPDGTLYSLTRVGSSSGAGDLITIDFETRTSEIVGPNSIRDLQAVAFQIDNSFGGDFYTFAVEEGETVTLSTSTPGDGPFGFENGIDPLIEIFDPNGATVGADDNSAADGRNALFTFTAAEAGDYTVRVASAAGGGEYVLSLNPQDPQVALGGFGGGADNAVAFVEVDAQGAGAGAGVLISEGATVFDPNADDTVDTIVVTLLNNRGDTGEALFFDGVADGVEITGSGEDEITITRTTGDIGDMQAALRAIRYQNDSDAPDQSDRFVQVIATDSDGNTSDVVTTTISVTASNDSPVAENATFASIDEDTVSSGAVVVSAVEPTDIPIALLASDLDDALAPTSFSFVSATIDGVDATLIEAGVSYDPNTGLFTFDPTSLDVYQSLDDTESAEVIVTFEVTDGEDTSTGTVTFSVTGANDAPVTATTALNVDEDTLLEATLAATDIDGDDLVFGEDLDATPPAHGQVTLGADGTFTYQPDENFNGTDTFGYTVTDGDETVSQTLTITVASVNDAPVAADPSFDPVDEDETFAGTFVVSASAPTDIPVSLFATDVDDTLDASSFTFTGATIDNVEAGGLAAAGVTYDSNTGAFSFDPTTVPAFQELKGGETATVVVSFEVSDGEATDTGTATFEVRGANTPPAPVTTEITTPEDVALNGTLAATDAEGADLTFEEDPENGPSNGSVTIASDGTFTYTPDANFFGEDSFSYIVSDGEASVTQAVTVTVTSVNDAPIAANDAPTPAADDFLADQTYTFDLLANDSDVETETLTIISVDGQAIASESSVTLTGSGATVTLNVDGTVTYDPSQSETLTALPLGETFSESFTYTIADGDDGSATANVALVVMGVNEPPVPVTTDLATDEDTPLSGTLEATDPETTDLTFAADDSQGPDNGTVDISEDGTFTYTPDADFFGEDSFTYTVSDGEGGATASQTVTVTVNAVNDAPVAADPVFPTVDEDETFSGTLVVTPVGATDIPISLFATDVDDALNPSAFTFTGVTIDGTDAGDLASAGISYDPDTGQFTFDPSSVPAFQSLTDGESATVVVSFDVTDGDETDSGTATFEVRGANETPIAVDDVFTDMPLSENETTEFDVADVLANDSDPDGVTLQVLSVSETSASGATVTLVDGVITYDPTSSATLQGLAAGATATDTFTYTIIDADGATADANVEVLIEGGNNAPVVSTLAVQTTQEDSGLFIFDLLTGASDPEDDPLSVANLDVSSDTDRDLTGQFAVVNNQLIFSPNLLNELGDGATETLTFTYEVTDGALSTPQTLTLVVTGAGDGAVIVGDDTGVVTEDDPVTTVSGTLNVSDVDAGEAAFNTTPVANGAAGSVTIDATGRWTYTLNNDAAVVDALGDADTLEDVVTVAALDGTTQDITITIQGANDAPVAVDDTAVTTEDSAIAISVLGNDVDPDDTPEIVGATDGANGTTTVNDDGTITYTPAADFSGTDSFTYEIGDGGDATSTATVTVTVTSVNDAPVAGDDAATTDEDAAITISVLANDPDVDGDPLSVDSASDGDNGTTTVNDDGTITYTPDADFSGADTFTYAISDGAGGTDTATVTVTVTPVNDAPAAADDGAATDEDTAVTISVLANDTDLDGDDLSVSSAADGANGTTIINDDGTITYTPGADFNGEDSFTYEISDGNGGFDTATVTVTVAPVNDDPVAVDDAATTDEDADVTISVLDNDTDVESAITITDVSDGLNGTTTLNADGTITYAPDADFSGTDTFTYAVSDGSGGTDTATVTVTVANVNDEPFAAEDAAATDEDTPVVISVLDNDTDIDGDTLSVTSASNGATGTTVINSDGTITYTPGADFSGADVFAYVVSDGNGGSDTTTVTVTVAAANDAPIAGDDTATTDEDTAVTVSVLDNDSDAEGDVTLTEATDGANGTTEIVDGAIVYTPDPDFSGTDSFTYTITDEDDVASTATVTVTVAPANDEPVALDDDAATDEDTAVTIDVLGNDTDIDADTLSIVSASDGDDGTTTINPDGTITYAPGANLSGTDTFSYVVSDGKGGSDTATVTITVTPVNDVPVAGDDEAATDEDTAVTIAVLDNDSDVEGVLTLTDATNGTNGTTEIVDGAIVYTPNADFSGADSFTYTVTDADDATTTATVTVTVAPANDAPVAAQDDATTDEDTVVTISVLGNDTDIDGDALTVASASNGANGATVVNDDGTITYTPNANFSGSDTFAYIVSDGNGGTDTTTVTVTVTPVNDDPIAVDDTATTDEETPVTIAVLDNDSDAEGDITLIGAANGANGTTEIVDGAIVYTPDANFSGADTFTYTITDENDVEATATVTVTVGTVNDLPVAGDDDATTDEDTAVTIAVLDNDSDIDGDDLLVASASDGANGSTTINADGTVTYIPDANFSGTDAFTYDVSDGNGGSDTATVTVTVTPVNDDPAAGDDTATTDQDTAVTISVLANDTDVETLPTVTAASDGANGTTVVNDDGTITYTPDADFSGEDTFTYTVSDGEGGFDTATVTVTVTPDGPTIRLFLINADTNQEVGEIGADGVIDPALLAGAPYAIEARVEGATPGSVALQIGSGPVQVENVAPYALFGDSAGDFAGQPLPTTGFTLTVAAFSQGFGLGATIVSNNFALSIGEPTEPPVPIDDTAETAEDTSVSIDVLSNDTDPSGGSLSVTAALASNGDVVVNPDNTLSYTPDPDFFGADTITYTVASSNGGTATGGVAVTVTPVNDAPTAIADSAETLVGQAVTIDVLANDLDIDGGPLTITSADQPPNGTVEVADGQIIYTPDGVFEGVETFAYEISDGSDVATAEVTVTVAADPPPPQNDIALFLIDPDTDAEVGQIGSDGVLDPDLLTGDGFSIEARYVGEEADDVESMTLEYLGGLQIESVAPYALFGDAGGDFVGQPVPAGGSITVTVKAFNQDAGAGDLLADETFTLTFADPTDQIFS